MCFFAIRQWLDKVMSQGEGLNTLADPRLQAVLEEIHKNPTAHWTVENLARLSGQSRTVFAGRFKDAIGLTPISYVARWRAELARKLLWDSDLSLDEVASRTGYLDTNDFNRAFKRETGSAPGAFRRASRR